MNNHLLVLLLSLSITILLIPIISIQPASALHETCTDGSPNLCDVTLDWQYTFSNIDGANSGSLNADENSQYRELYKGISTARNRDVYRALAGFSMAERGGGGGGIFDLSNWIGSRYSDHVGFPEYRFEVHGWGTGASPEVTIDSGDTQKYLTNTGSYDGSWTKNGNDDLNKFKADTIEGRMSVPENTEITVEIYESSSKSNILDTIEFKHKPRYGDNKRLRSKEVQINNYQPVYWLSLKLERDSTSDKKPVLNRAVLLKRELPQHRLTTRPYFEYPSILSDHNEKMLENYEDTSSSLDDKTSLSPRLEKSRYTSKQVNDAHFQSNTNVFHNVYTAVPTVDKNILIQEGWLSGDITEGAWESVISDKGTAYMVYDGGVSDPPNDGDYFNNPNDSPDTQPPDGTIRWKYVLDEVEYEPILDVWEISGGSETRSELKRKDKSDPGFIEYDYNSSKFPIKLQGSPDNAGFESKLNMQVTYDVEYDEYVWDYKSCPPDTTTGDPNKSYSDILSGYETACSDPSDDYHYPPNDDWEDYQNARASHSSPYPPSSEVKSGAVVGGNTIECVQYAMNEFINKDNDCETYKFNKLARSNYSIATNATNYNEYVSGTSGSDFNIYNGYLSTYSGKTFVEKTGGKKWTSIKSKSISDRETIFVEPKGSGSNEKQVPVVDGERGDLETSGSKSVGGTSIPDSYDYENKKALDGTIESDMNVSLSLYTSGPISASDQINVDVNGNNVLTKSGISVSKSGILSMSPVERKINITSAVKGDDSININIDHSGSDKSQDIRFDYIVNINTSSVVSDYSSRWKYMTFRDANWDIQYKFKNSCHRSECFDYDSHGYVIADGNNRNLTGGSSVLPSEVDYKYPTTGHPVKTYLVPTSGSIDTDKYRGEKGGRIYPNESIIESNPPSSSDALSDSEITNTINDLNGVEVSTVNKPLKSDYCPYSSVKGYKYCGIQSGDFAGFEDEYNYTETTEFDPSEYHDKASAIVDSSKYDYNTPSDSASSVVSTDDELTTKYDPSRYYGYSNYTTIRNDDTEIYPEYTQFIINSENKQVGSWHITNAVKWESQKVPDSSTQNVFFDGVNIDAQPINDINSYLTSSEKSSLQSETTDHEFIDEPPYSTMSDKSNLTQMKISVVDEYGRQIDFSDRRSNSLSHKIEIEDSEYISATGNWRDQEIILNETGNVYVVLNNSKDMDATFLGDERDSEWWKHSADKRLLISKEEPVKDLYVEDNRTNNISLSGEIRLILIVLFGLIIVLSMVFRTYPQSNMSIMKLGGIVFEPFREVIGQFVEVLMYLLMFSIILMAFVAGSGQNPFFLIEAILDAII